MPAAHGRVADLEFQHGLCRVQRVQRLPVGGVEGGFACLLFQVGVKRGHAGLGQLAYRLAQHQAHQVVVGVIAARHLAGKAGGHGKHAVDLGLVFVAVKRLHLVHQAVFQQALVNAAQVGHRQVAVVDPAAQQVFGAARERVDDGRHHFVGHLGAVEQGRARPVEQAAVVGRYANVVVALVNQAEHATQREPNFGHGAAERAPGVHLVAHRFADAPHAVFGVTRVAHGQQVAVFGVKHEEQAVQKHQSGLAHLVQIRQGELRAPKLAQAHRLGLRVHVAARQCVGELRKNIGKHARAQILRDTLFVQARFVERVGVETAVGAVPALWQKRAARKEQVKQLQRVGRLQRVQVARNARHTQRLRHVHLKKIFRARTCVLPIQAPDIAIGQNAPFHRPVGHHIGAAQVAQHLARRRVGVGGLAAVAPVQGPQPALGL